MSRRSSPRLFFALLGLLLVIVAGWTAFWFLARSQAAGALAEVDAALAREGWTRRCAEEGWSGYPFRLAFRCTNLTLKGPDTTLTLPSIDAALQVHDPSTVILSASSPLAAVTPEGQRTLSFDDARGSARFDGGSALVVTAGAVNPVLAVENGPQLKAASLDVSVRPAADAIGVTVALADPALADPATLAAKRIAIEGTLSPPPPPAPTAEQFLRRAALAGTALELTSATIEAQEFSLSGKGRLALTRDGLVDGKVRVEAKGPGAVADRLRESGALSGDNKGLDALSAMLSAIGSTALTVTVNQGTVIVGPFKVGQLPPVF